MVDPLELLAIRLEAMRSVCTEDQGYILRSICRWYSGKFATPLHEVGTPEGRVPLEDVLKTFYEVRYDEMDDLRREQEIHVLVTTPEEEREANLRADIKEAEDWEFARFIEAQEIAKAKKKAMQERQQQGQPTMETTKVVSKEERELTAKPMPLPQMVDNDGTRRGPQQPDWQAMTKTPPAKRRPLDGPPEQDPYGPPPPRKPGEAMKPSMVETTLPEDIKVIFMTDEEMERDVVDPFAIERPPGAPRPKPPPRTKPKKPQK